MECHWEVNRTGFRIKGSRIRRAVNGTSWKANSGILDGKLRMQCYWNQTEGKGGKWSGEGRGGEIEVWGDGRGGWGGGEVGVGGGGSHFDCTLH